MEMIPSENGAGQGFGYILYTTNISNFKDEKIILSGEIFSYFIIKIEKQKYFLIKKTIFATPLFLQPMSPTTVLTTR